MSLEVHVNTLSCFAIMSLHMLSSKAKECVHTHIQASFWLLQKKKVNNDSTTQSQKPTEWQIQPKSNIVQQTQFWKNLLRHNLVANIIKPVILHPGFVLSYVLHRVMHHSRFHSKYRTRMIKILKAHQYFEGSLALRNVLWFPLEITVFLDLTQHAHETGWWDICAKNLTSTFSKKALLSKQSLSCLLINSQKRTPETLAQKQKSQFNEKISAA